MGRTSAPQYWVRLKGPQPETFQAFSEFARYCRDTLARVLALEVAHGAALANARTFPAVRQTVLTGDVDSNNRADFLTDSGLIVTSTATKPLLMTFADGFDALGPVDYMGHVTAVAPLAWSLPINSTSYLYVERSSTGALSTGYVDIAPSYSTVEPAAGLVPGSGTAVSGGDLPPPPTYQASNAFDGNTATFWASSQIGAAVTGVAYIGLDFGVSTQVAAVDFLSHGFTNNNVTSVQPMWSNDGSSWTAIGAPVAVSASSSTVTPFVVPTYTPARYFALWADSPPTDPTAAWAVNEITLMVTAAPSHWFDLSTFKMKEWDGSAWIEVVRLFVGRAITDGSGVTSLRSYAFLGQYDSGWRLAQLLVTDILAHNIGVCITHGVSYEVLFSSQNDSYQDAYPASPYYVNSSGQGVGYILADMTPPLDPINSDVSLVVNFPGTYTQDFLGSNLTNGYYRVRLSRTW